MERMAAGAGLQMPWIQVRLPIGDMVRSNSLAWCETFKELWINDTAINDCHIGIMYASITLPVPHWHTNQIVGKRHVTVKWLINNELS